MQELKQRGDRLAQAGDFAGALAAFNEALDIDRNDAAAHEAVAQLHIELEDDQAALAAAARAVELDQNVCCMTALC